MAQQAPGRVQRRARRAAGVEEVGQIGAAGDAHAGQADQVQRRAQLVDPRAELAAVERLGAQRAAAQYRAGAGVHVRHAAAGLELHGGVALEELDHRRAVGEEGALALVQFGALQLLAQVALGRARLLELAVGDRQRVARNPQPAAGPGAGAAEQRFLLGDHHLEAVVRGGHRGGQAGRAGADHQHVAFDSVGRLHVLPLVVVVRRSVVGANSFAKQAIGLPLATSGPRCGPWRINSPLQVTHCSGENPVGRIIRDSRRSTASSSRFLRANAAQRGSAAMLARRAARSSRLS
ncbi:hypothetical protein D3C85_560310 [compost metagenome]